MLNLAIVLGTKPKITETFFTNHINKLPFKVTVIYGEGGFPFKTDEYQGNKIIRLLFRLYDSFFKKKDSYAKVLFKKALKRNKIDYVLAEYLVIAGQVAPLCQEMGLPITTTALGYDISMTAVLEKNKLAYEQLFKICRAVVVVSNHMRINLKKFDCPDSKIIYSPAGADDSFFDIQPSMQHNQILAIGRFVPKKAPHLTILALQHVVAKIPDVVLIFAGYGLLLETCRDLVNGLGLSKNVKFIGSIDQNQQKELLESSTVFVQHSKVAADGDSEGTPVAILEASAAGLPIVSTLHAGIPEVVVDKETGYLVPEGAVQEMAEKIIFLLENKDIAMKMGQKGKNHVRNNFSLETHLNTLAAAIKGTMSD